MTKESQEREVATAMAEFTAEMQKRLEGKFGTFVSGLPGMKEDGT